MMNFHPELKTDFYLLTHKHIILFNIIYLLDVFIFVEGYGREYRERLLGQWGVVDVNDSCSCATFLVGLYAN
jgi:hypothetical protein